MNPPVSEKCSYPKQTFFLEKVVREGGACVHITHAQRHSYPRSYFCFHARCYSSLLQNCTSRKTAHRARRQRCWGRTPGTRCRGQPPLAHGTAGIPFQHEGDNPPPSRSEAEDTGTTSTSPAMMVTTPASPTPAFLNVPHVPPPSVRAGRRKKSVLICLNSQHLSQNGDSGCVVHVHEFSGDREQHAVRCDQCVDIVLSKHTSRPMKAICKASSRPRITSSRLRHERGTHFYTWLLLLLTSSWVQATSEIVSRGPQTHPLHSTRTQEMSAATRH